MRSRYYGTTNVNSVVRKILTPAIWHGYQEIENIYDGCEDTSLKTKYLPSLHKLYMQYTFSSQRLQLFILLKN